MMNKFLCALAGAMALFSAEAYAQWHSQVVREYVTPTGILHTEGDVRDAHRLLVPGTGQATIDGNNCCSMKGESYILLDFGQEMHGGIKIVTGMFEGNEPVKVRIRFGESVSEACCEIDGQNGASNDHCIRDFVTELPWLGSREFTPAGFRFVRIDMLEPDRELLLREVGGISIGSNDPVLGSFSCSDERLTRIWNTGARTVKLNMQDYLWDGIKRDRLIWSGDMFTEVMTVFSVFGNTDIITRSLDFERDIYPMPEWMHGFSSYSIWWLMNQSEWYLHYGDMEYLNQQKDYLFSLVQLLIGKVDENGHEHLDGNRFLDWPSNVNEPAEDCGLHALLMIALKRASDLCEVLDNKELARQCDAAHALLRKASPEVVRKYESIGQDSDQPGMKQAAALMYLAGMYGERKATDVITYRNGHGFSTFYGYFMLEALAKAGKYQEALDIISEYWGGMLDLGATSFWEDFDLDWIEGAGRIDEMPQEGKIDVHRAYGKYCYQGYRHSFCHGWASGPTAWLSRHVLGLLPAEAGQGRLYVDPHLGNLEWAEGTCPTDQGLVKIRVEKKKNGSITATVSAPSSITLIPSKGVSLVTY